MRGASLRISAAWCAASSRCPSPARTRRRTIRWRSPRLAASVGLAADAAPDVEAAIARLQKLDGGPLRILICGSLYLAGHVLALQEGVQAQMN